MSGWMFRRDGIRAWGRGSRKKGDGDERGRQRKRIDGTVRGLTTRNQK